MPHLGIITALRSEALCFNRVPTRPTPAELGDHISLVCCGMGQEAAATAATQLLDNGAGILLSCGMAGALSPAVMPGDLLLPGQVRMDSGQYYSCDETWLGLISRMLEPSVTAIHHGDLYSSDTAVANADSKLRLGMDTDTIAIDMESAAIMERAAARNVPALVVRTVIDPVDFTLPQFILAACNRYGEMRPRSLLKSIIINPLRIITLYRLAIYHRQACRSLAYFADQLLQEQAMLSDQIPVDR